MSSQQTQQRQASDFVTDETTVAESPLVASEVTFGYGVNSPVVKNVSLTVERGAAIGIVGESGSGKTTFASLLVGMLTPQVGTVAVFGQPWNKVTRRSPHRRAVQMVFQNPYTALNPRLTAIETVSEVYRACIGLSKTDAAERARELLEQVGIRGRAVTKRSVDLSGGQCQRVGIARALAADPAVIVADEPTSALDVSVQAQILNLLDDLRADRGVGLVLVSHDLNVVSYLTERAIVMHRGEVVEEGATSQLLEGPSHPYTQSLLDAAF